MEPVEVIEGGAKRKSPKKSPRRKSPAKRKSPKKSPQRKSPAKRKSPKKSPKRSPAKRKSPKKSPKRSPAKRKSLKKSPKRSPAKKSPKRKTPQRAARTQPARTPARNTGGYLYFTFKFTPFDDAAQPTPPAKQNWAAIQANLRGRLELEDNLAEMAFKQIVEDNIENLTTEGQYASVGMAQFDNRTATWTFAVRISSKMAYLLNGGSEFSFANLEREFKDLAADTQQEGLDGVITLTEDGTVGYFIDLDHLTYKADKADVRKLQEADLRNRITLELMSEHNFDAVAAFDPDVSLATLKKRVKESSALIAKNIEDEDYLHNPTPAEIDAAVEKFYDENPMFT